MSDQQPGYPPQPPYQGQPPQAVQPAGTSSSLGRVGLILGIAALVVDILSSLTFQIMLRLDAYQLYGIVNLFGTFVVFALALAALVLGLISLRRPNDSKAVAGIATGIGATMVIGNVVSFGFGTLGSLLYF